MWLYALSALGAALYVLAGSGFAIDRVRCNNWPPVATGLLAAGLFTLALAAMALAWFGLGFRPKTVEAGQSAWVKAMSAGVLVHAIILIAPPFLSDDPLAYGAIGSLMALHGQDMYAPLGALPDDDAYRRLIGQYAIWLAHPSTYGPAVNALFALVVGFAGDNVHLALRLFQLGAALLIFATGFLAASAAGAWAAKDERRGDPHALRLTAFRLVVFSPLSMIEATGNAHNDVLLALGIAGFAWAMTRNRSGLALFVLLLGLLAKASAVLPLGFELARRGFRLLPRLPGRITLGLLALVALTGGALAWFGLPLLSETASTAVRLLAPPDGGTPFCTRSLECAPRWLFHFVLNWPIAAWLIGLAFRAGGIALMLVMAWRSRQRDGSLSGIAAFILFYYLFFHGYMQAWYLLSLLPLVIFLSAPLQVVAAVFVLSSLAQYGLDFVWSCTTEMPWVALREIGGLIVVLLPPLAVLFVVSGVARRRTVRRR